MTNVFPDTQLRSGRLLLRPFTAADVHDTQASCADELTQRWLPLPQPYTLENAEAWCTRVAHALRANGDGIHFAVTDLVGGRLLGTIGLKKTDWRARISEVGTGYRLGRAAAASPPRRPRSWPDGCWPSSTSSGSNCVPPWRTSRRARPRSGPGSSARVCCATRDSCTAGASTSSSSPGYAATWIPRRTRVNQRPHTPRPAPLSRWAPAGSRRAG
ncbi:GNAT family N-acetyltransferase [Actinospica durhamensis]|uniref:GNAT family N-acetyltransferase n=1 Tax=Actinospica durhamensis TaxID=1508375 RepID=A0A941EZB6_9ACTN|nr:GNAT family N-acetyltransferase [Actinospica durhamensis]